MKDELEVVDRLPAVLSEPLHQSSEDLLNNPVRHVVRGLGLLQGLGLSLPQLGELGRLPGLDLSRLLQPRLRFGRESPEHEGEAWRPPEQGLGLLA